MGWASLATAMIWAGCATRTPLAEPQPVMPDAAAMVSEPNLPEAQLAEDATVSDYLFYAAAHNPDLRAAYYRWQAATEMPAQVGALPDPQFSYRYFIEEIETRVGAQRQAFGVRQMLPWPGKLDQAADAATSQARALHADYEAALRRLFQQVRTAYYEYAYLAEATRVTRANVKLLEQLEAVVRTRYQAAAAGHPDLIRLQIQRAQVQDRLRSLEQMRPALAADLNAALNRPAETEIPWPSTRLDVAPALPDRAERAAAVAGHPDLQRLEHERNAAMHRLERARLAPWPDVMVGVDYIDTADSIAARPPIDDGKDAISVSVAVDVPLAWGKYEAAIRAAQADRRRAAVTITQRRNELDRLFAKAWFRLEDADRRRRFYRDNLTPKARESYRVSEAAFRAGTRDFSDLIESQQLLLEYELGARRAWADQNIALADISFLAGDFGAADGLQSQ